MPSKMAESSGNNNSITNYLSRAPGLLRTWNSLSDSDSDSGSDKPKLVPENPLPVNNTPSRSKSPTYNEFKRDSLVSPQSAKSVPAQINMGNTLSLRFSPQTERTVILPMDGAVATPSQLQRQTSLSSSPQPFETIREAPSITQNAPPTKTVSPVIKQRIVAKKTTNMGRQYIPGSDDESDDSLEDLDAILGVKPVVKKPLIRAPQTGRIGKMSIAKPAVQKLTTKEKLEKMKELAQAQKDKLERISGIERQLRYQESMSATSNPGKLEITEELLRTTGGDEQEPEDVKRTMESMKRIEALQEEIAFHFFESTISDIEPREFPTRDLTNDPWMTPLKGLGGDRTVNAFKSGYLARVARTRPLPISVHEWIFDAICAEAYDTALVRSCINVLDAAQTKFPIHLDPNRIRNLFGKLGAKSIVLNGMPVTSELQNLDSPVRPIPTNLHWLIETIRRLAANLPRGTVEISIDILVRLAIDDSVRQDFDLKTLIMRTISELICTFDTSPAKKETLERTSCKIFNSIQHPILRHRVIQALPTSPASAHFFRRQLAMSFGLGRSPDYAKTFDNNAEYSHVILHMKNHILPQLRRKPDFAELMAVIKMLDIAVDEGFNASSLPDTIPCPAPTVEARSEVKSKQDFFKPRTISKPTEVKPERAFDASVDRLTSVVKTLRDAIVTNGVSEISKLECHSTLERFVQRLECSIRTREPQDIFIDNSSGEVATSTDFQGTLQQKERARTTETRMDVDK